VAFELELPKLWESRGWKAKIRDRERVDPPYVTIMHKADSWRRGLRSQQFLDKKLDPKEVPTEVQMNSQVLLVEPRGRGTGLFQRLKASRLHFQSDVRAAMTQRSVYSLWIAPSEPAVELPLGTLPHRPADSDLRLLSLKRAASTAAQNLLHAHFRFVVSVGDGVQLLPIAELIEVLESDHRSDLLIGGIVMPTRSEVLLYRGNFEPITIPLNWFAPRSGSADPDVSKFAVTDYGQTIRRGDCEASTDAILYEFDEDYRRRAKKRRADEDESIGGAIRRLRLQKGLRQSDFPGVTAKEIARIEPGKVKKPHKETLRKIADQTGVPVDQIETY